MTRRRAPRDLLLAAEALRLLLAARWQVRQSSLKDIAAALEALPGFGDAHDAAAAVDIGWAIGAVARRLPLRLLCYESGIAAFRMLSRRGLAAAFHYGVSRDDGGLTAHVWVTSGPLPVVGCGTAHGFREVLTVSR
jgi:hypothetical protein